MSFLLVQLKSQIWGLQYIGDVHSKAQKNKVSWTNLIWRSKCDSEKHKIRKVIFQTFCSCENHNKFTCWGWKVYRRTIHHLIDSESAKQLLWTIAPVCNSDRELTHFLSCTKKNSKPTFWACKSCSNFNVKEVLPCMNSSQNFRFELFSRQSEKWPKKSST